MFKQEIKRCSQCDCGEERLIVNRTHMLCQEKNRERLDSQSQTKKQRQSNLLKSSVVGLKKTKLKPQSNKGKTMAKDYLRVCVEIVKKRGYLCEGCGIPNRPLSNSHLIPRSISKDLVICEDNIRLHCLEWNGVMGCHDKWEQGLWDGMLDLEENLNIVKRLDFNYYKKILVNCCLKDNDVVSLHLNKLNEC